MEQYNATITIKNHEQEEKMKLKINISEDRIWYIENDINKTLTLFNLKDDTLERDNKEIYLKYSFKENNYTNNLLEIKSFNSNTNVEIYTKKIIKSDSLLRINYLIDDNEFIYEIKILK